MEAITYTAARQNLAKTMEKVCKDRAPIIVT
ncbi:MAG: type II toxin-antitoxin system Phd/YefM family antitoxin, partial [Thermodesulfobacteriota bacterium]